MMKLILYISLLFTLSMHVCKASEVAVLSSASAHPAFKELSYLLSTARALKINAHLQRTADLAGVERRIEHYLPFRTGLYFSSGITGSIFGALAALGYGAGTKDMGPIVFACIEGSLWLAAEAMKFFGSMEPRERIELLTLLNVINRLPKESSDGIDIKSKVQEALRKRDASILIPHSNLLSILSGDDVTQLLEMANPSSLLNICLRLSIFLTAGVAIATGVIGLIEQEIELLVLSEGGLLAACILLFIIYKLDLVTPQSVNLRMIKDLLQRGSEEQALL